MLSTLALWFAILLAVSIVLAVVKVRREHRRRYHRPIICMCEVNGRIGVVLRRDYDEASRNYWKPYYDATAKYDSGSSTAPYGHRLEVSPVFVFTWSGGYYELAQGCYVERATFDVPHVAAAQLNPIAEAFQYFHGYPWDGRLVSTWL